MCDGSNDEETGHTHIRGSDGNCTACAAGPVDRAALAQLEAPVSDISDDAPDEQLPRAELRARCRVLRARLEAVTTERDTAKAQADREMQSWQYEREAYQRRCAAAEAETLRLRSAVGRIRELHDRWGEIEWTNTDGAIVQQSDLWRELAAVLGGTE